MSFHMVCDKVGVDQREHIDSRGHNKDDMFTTASLHNPDVDALARNGMKFTQFYATYPICTPSRSGLLTGRWGLLP